MKPREIAQALPHLYLDMDGVQADFFGAWSARHNVSHWKAIQDKEKEIEELAHSSESDVYDFFINLESLAGGMQVVQWLKSNGIAFTVLSAPLRGPFAAASIQAKKDWLNKFNPGTSSSAIFTSEKYKYAITNSQVNVLVDDFGPYLTKWNNAGGIAIKHEDEYELVDSGAHTIQALQQIYFR